MRYFLFLALFFILNISFSQNRIEYRITDKRLIIFTDSNSFTIKCTPDYYRDEYSDSLKSCKFATGRVLITKTTIKLIDSATQSIIILRKIDKYRLLVLNNNKYLKYNSIVCPTAQYYNNGKWVHSMSWKNGLKNGEWSYQTLDGYKYEIYENGRLIKMYFQTYKQLMDSINELPGDL